MKFSPHSSFGIDYLKGAIVTTPEGGEFRILGFEINLALHQLNVILFISTGEQANSTFIAPWENMTDWEIHFQSPY